LILVVVVDADVVDVVAAAVVVVVVVLEDGFCRWPQGPEWNEPEKLRVDEARTSVAVEGRPSEAGEIHFAAVRE
jgi:hypothetical protein